MDNNRLNRVAQIFLFKLEKLLWVLGDVPPLPAMDPPLCTVLLIPIPVICTMCTVSSLQSHGLNDTRGGRWLGLSVRKAIESSY